MNYIGRHARGCEGCENPRAKWLVRFIESPGEVFEAIACTECAERASKNAGAERRLL